MKNYMLAKLVYYNGPRHCYKFLRGAGYGRIQAIKAIIKAM